MSVRYIPSNIAGEFRDPCDCDERFAKPWSSAAFVAPADGRIDAVARDERVDYVSAPMQSVPLQSKHCCVANRAHAQGAKDDWRLERLIDRLPKRIRAIVRFVREPSRRWLRIPMAILLTLGGLVWFLPIAGLWMLPVGLALLADDVQFLQSLRSRTLHWVEHYRPGWLADGSRAQ
jgi:hypothetical protein